MLEHSIYSVISPEGCASILWKDPLKTREAAEALRLTAQDLNSLGVVDRVITEPVGGAQRDRSKAINDVGEMLDTLLAEFDGMSRADVKKHRRKKFLEMGNKGLAA